MKTLGAFGFRSLFHQLVLLRIDNVQDLFVEGLIAPDNFDAVLAYPYIDRTAGLTFDVLAPARFDDEFVFNDMALLLVQNRRLILRRSSISDATPVKIPKSDDELAEVYAEHIAMNHEYYSASESVLATRQIEAIDHLRNRDYPDDVMVLLVSEEHPGEMIWVRLMGIEESGILYGELLNEPFSDFGVHNGSIMRLGVTRDGNEELLLFTANEYMVDDETHFSLCSEG